MKNIAIIGLGYVGLPLALLTAEKGYDVTGVDLDAEKINLLKQKKDPIGEKFIAERLASSQLEVTTSSDSIKSSDIVIVCVPTPVKNNFEPDLGPVKGAVSAIANNMKKGTIVIIESTINPGVCDEVVIPLLEKESGLVINSDFYVSHCPERINPGDEKWSVENIPRVVGSSNEKGLDLTAEFYESIVSAPIKKMGSLKEAEACKVVENSFRDINIAFVNELAKSFTKLDINVKNVIDGAATKPFAFMAHYPSTGVGGHCIPVDPYYLIEYARGYGFEHEFLSLARSINNSMPEYTIDRLIEALNISGITLGDAKVAILGLSYKANVADDRESPSYKLIRILEDKGVKPNVFDPYFLAKSTAESTDEAVKNADAVIVAANHDEFTSYDYSKTKIKVLIDGKNCINKDSLLNSKIIYRGIGVN